MVQNKPLCTHNPALMIFSSQSGLLYVPTPILTSIILMHIQERSCLYYLRLFFFSVAFGSPLCLQALKLWCAGWVVVCGILVLQTRTAPTPALEHRVLSTGPPASPHDASLKSLLLTFYNYHFI